MRMHDDQEEVVDDGKTIELVTFHLGDLWIGINIHEVQEIIRLRNLTVVPHAAEMVRGVVNLRGDVITIVDLRSVLRLGTTPVNDATQNVIVRSGDEMIGILVDRVGDVVFAHEDSIEPAPGNLEARIGDYVAKVHKTENALLCILDTDKALANQLAETATS
ncbi:MAG: chemotaxis protein CheW [Phycisphaerales bacterium]